MWDLSSTTRDGTVPPALGAQSLNHWTTREVLKIDFISGRTALSHVKASFVPFASSFQYSSSIKVSIWIVH